MHRHRRVALAGRHGRGPTLLGRPPRLGMGSTAALYIVATPIGNLADMVPRGLTILQQVAVIAAEDTRHSRRLLDHFGIDTPLVAYHDHSGPQVLAALRQRWSRGEQVALISDAGTPLVADPGYRLVDAAHVVGVRVVPFPGPRAALASLFARCLPSDRFVSECFLPARSTAPRHRLRQLFAEERSLVFYRAPHRLQHALSEAVVELHPERPTPRARELSKQFESVRRAPLGA